MPEEFIGAISFGALSAITWLAYKHPKGYQRLYIPLAIMLFVPVIGYLCWVNGVRYGFSALAGRTGGLPADFGDYRDGILFSWKPGCLYRNSIIVRGQLGFGQI